ncbi:hypothetical protein PbB2_02761 [Candidatus Phycosocius bacilliformis]|uniref:Uncharacterized protein n=1 Tax=Candidatus Phycosocius bacilliformis TaxID=1445552 RepID=A0A2P2EDC6_9PROT|nr:hypothetical protein PbB2_02761 [Candidatus Phycosocius bacilliformis]
MIHDCPNVSLPNQSTSNYQTPEKIDLGKALLFKEVENKSGTLKSSQIAESLIKLKVKMM